MEDFVKPPMNDPTTSAICEAADGPAGGLVREISEVRTDRFRRYWEEQR